MFENKKLNKLERRIASLEDTLGMVWYDGLEEHHVYFVSKSDDNGALQELYERTRESHNVTKLYRLLDYLGLTEVTYPQKTVIEKVKDKK